MIADDLDIHEGHGKVSFLAILPRLSDAAFVAFVREREAAEPSLRDIARWSSAVQQELALRMLLKSTVVAMKPP